MLVHLPLMAIQPRRTPARVFFQPRRTPARVFPQPRRTPARVFPQPRRTPARVFLQTRRTPASLSQTRRTPASLLSLCFVGPLATNTRNSLPIVVSLAFKPPLFRRMAAPIMAAQVFPHILMHLIDRTTIHRCQLTLLKLILRRRLASLRMAARVFPLPFHLICRATFYRWRPSPL